ncbi:hypothetical protein GQ457_11G002140 [Hibiscus cannabinus]
MDGRLLHQEGENRDVRLWSEINQSQNGDSLPDGYISRYAESTCVNVRQNDVEELRQVWESLDTEGRQFFFKTYGDIAHLLYVQVDETMLQALIQFWNPGYCCFTLNGKDLMPTVEEYSELLRIPNVMEGKVYTKPDEACNRFVTLSQLAGRSTQWAGNLFSKKGGNLCFPWYSIAEIARTYPDNYKKAHLLAVAIYGLVLFPRTLGYIDVAIFEVFNQFKYNISPVPAILAETFLSLNACRQLEGGRFRGCVPLLYVWIKSHFWKIPRETLSGINFTNFSPLKEFLEKTWDEVDSTKWVEAFRNLQDHDLVWRVPWLRCRKFLYRCSDHDWLMLLGLWGAIGCAPLLVSRQFGSRQFVPYTAGLADSEFFFDTDFKARVTKINKSWKHSYWIKTVYDSKGMVTPEYVSWMQTRVNDTIPLSNQSQEVPIEDRLRVFPSEADLLRIELADARAEIEKMGEKHVRDLFLKKVEVDEYEGKAVRAMEKYSTLKIDFDLQKEELRRLEAAVKHMELRKTPAEWRREIQHAKDRQKHLAKLKIEKERKTNQKLLKDEKKKGKEVIEQYQHALEAERDNTAAWKRKSHDSKIRLTESQNAYNTLEAQLNQSRDQYAQLEARVREQEAMIHEYQTRDEYAELQASQNKIEKLEKEVKDLWALVQTCQISIQVLEDIKQGGNDYWFTRLRNAAHRFQEQDKINEKIMNLAQDVAEHVTAIAREARILRPHVVSREMKSSLEMLFDQINDLGSRVKPYLPNN